MTELIEKSIRTVAHLISEGRLEDSETICRQVLRVDEQNSEAMCLLSCCLKRLGRGEESSKFMDRAIEASGESSKFHNSLGISCMHVRELERAIGHFSKARELDPSDENPPFNIGSCMMMMGRPKEALQSFREAYARSKSIRSTVGMACAKAECLDLDGATALLEMALERDPEDTSAKTNMAHALHLMGRWDEAWNLYPSRLKHYTNLAKYVERIGLPLWSGEDPKGENILVFSEQGMGDALNFWRFVPELERRFPDSNVGVLATASLKSILSRQGIKMADGPDGFGLCCSVMDLPGLLGMRRDEVENSFVGMKHDGTCDMSMFGEVLKVGVCWAGNPAHPKDASRSCRLKEFSVLQMPGVKLFSVQKDLRPRIWPFSPEPVDLAEDCGEIRLVNMAPHMNSWEETAAIISSLDLVVSVDTSVMHLAAGMGKETWGLIPYVPDWRWGLGTERSCWYPTLRLFRQSSPGDWRGVFSAVRDALEEKLGGRGH